MENNSQSAPWQIIRDEILFQLDMTRDISDEELKAMIRARVTEYSKSHIMSLGDRIEFERKIFNAFRKLDVIQEILDDDEVTEIMINGPENIFYEKNGRVMRWEGGRLDDTKLADMIQQIVGSANRTVNEACPIVDTRLKDGSRVNVVLSPVSIDGSAVSIRKFSKEPMSIRRLLDYGSMSEEIAEFLGKLVAAGYNIFVSGGTGSGKTTFLNALSDFIPSDERIVTIEDSAELQITRIPNIVRLETRNANSSGAQAITIRDLIKTALRMRPDRIIVGEVRGAEALDMLQACNTGHDGSMSTGHSNSCKDMLYRLETMVLMGSVELPLEAVRRQIESGIDIIVQLGRLRDKSRKVLEIAELDGMENGAIRMRTIYRFEESGEKDGHIIGGWIKEADLVHQGKLRSSGIA